MRSQQGSSRHSTLCLVSHLVSLSTSLRSAHVQQNCYYRTLGHATRWREEVGAMSAKRKKRAPKSGAVWLCLLKKATLAKKPRYNGYACGHGAHGDAKYSRTKSKRAWQKRLIGQKSVSGPIIHSFRNGYLVLWWSSSHTRPSLLWTGASSALMPYRSSRSIGVGGHRAACPPSSSGIRTCR